jgi:hypothetical protein
MCGFQRDRTTREEWIKEKYVKKTFGNTEEIARFEAARNAITSPNNGLNSPRSTRNSGQRTTQRKGPQASSTWRPWQGVVSNYARPPWVGGRSS